MGKFIEEISLPYDEKEAVQRGSLGEGVISMGVLRGEASVSSSLNEEIHNIEQPQNLPIQLEKGCKGILLDGLLDGDEIDVLETRGMADGSLVRLLIPLRDKLLSRERLIITDDHHFFGGTSAFHSDEISHRTIVSSI